MLEARQHNGTWSLTLDVGVDSQDVLREIMRQDDVKLERFEIAEPSLEDIFVTVVQRAGRCGGRSMRNLWLVAKHEYLKIVRKKSFLLGTLGIPVLMIVVMVVSYRGVALGQRGTQPLGYVDHAGILDESLVVSR